MAQYKDKNGHWYIVCTSPITHKKTTIRKNPLKHTNFQTKTEAKEYEFYFIHNKIDHNIRFGNFSKFIEMTISEEMFLTTIFKVGTTHILSNLKIKN